MTGDRIAADGVVLRRLTEHDVDDVVAAGNDPETQRFLTTLPDPYTRGDALDWITRQRPAVETGGSATYAIADPATDRLIGSVGVSAPDVDGFATSLGYWVAPWARGQGVATRGTRALAAHMFARGLGRIELATARTNEASMRVAIGAGFRHEGLRRAAGVNRDGSRRDLVIWSRLANDDGVPTRRTLPDLPGGRLDDGLVALYPVVAGDADDLQELRTLPEVLATTVADSPPTPEATTDRCATAAYQWLIGARAEFVVRDAATGAFAGDIGLFRHPATGEAMTGYGLLREWRGRRYAEHAVRLLAAWAFAEVGIARLGAGTAPWNIASQRTLERAGFTREGYERGRLPGPDGTRIDNVAYALLPGDPG